MFGVSRDLDHPALLRLEGVYQDADNIVQVVHCKDTIPKIRNKYLPGKELRGYSPNSYIHVSVSDLNIPLIGLPILLQENRWAERGKI